MADSRHDSRRHYSDRFRPFFGKFGLFSLTLLIALLLARWTVEPSFSISQRWILFLIFFAVGLWLTEAIPPFAVGIFIIGFLVYTQGSAYLTDEPESVSKYVNTWASPVIWLMLGGFFLAEGMRKTQLDQGLFRLSTSLFGNGPWMILLGLMLTTALASMIMSNTATTAMMIASVTPLARQLGQNAPFCKAMLLGIPASATVGGMGTIIGSPPNAIAVGILESKGIQIDFLTWMFYGLPLALLLTLLFWWILSRKYASDLAEGELRLQTTPQADKPRQKLNRGVVIFTLVITLGLWLTSPLHGLHVAAVSGLPIILLTMSGVIRAQDVRGLPWDTLMLVAGGLALGIAIVDSGLAEYYVAKIQIDTSQGSVWGLLFLFAYLTVILSNVMSNTATATILIPIAMILMGTQSLTAALIIGLTASTALFLPVSTPPNAIAFSTGLLEQADFRLGGLFIGTLGPLLIIIWIWILV